MTTNTTEITPMKFIQIDKMSDILRKATERERARASATGSDLDLHDALHRIAHRINAGEENLYDPENSGDCLCLVLAQLD
jgi:hypothetical protein